MSKTNEPADMQRIRDEHQALEILRLLLDPVFNGMSNDHIIGPCLDRFALGGSREQIRQALSRLDALGLMQTNTFESFGETYVTVRLTDAGERVALGEDVAEGVARPSRG
jgi:hypothetical protein